MNEVIMKSWQLFTGNSLTPEQKIQKILDSAKSYLEKQEYEKAEYLYTQAINGIAGDVSLKNKLPLAYEGRALAYHSLGEYQNSIEDWNKLLACDEGNQSATAYFYRGTAHHFLNKFDLAIIDLTRAIGLKPGPEITILVSTYLHRA